VMGVHLPFPRRKTPRAPRVLFLIE